MGTQGTGRRRSTKERSTAEDEALSLVAREAEARLAAKRAARAEAREIRMKELERQQKEIFQVQKKYYGLNTRVEERDRKWGDIEQWMEDSEKFSRSSRIHTLSDDDERMSVGSRGSVRSDLDPVGAYGGGGSSLHRKSKKKKKHKHRDRDRNGCDDDYSVLSSRSSRLSDESRTCRSSRLDLQPPSCSSYASSDLYDLSRHPGLAFNGYQSSLYEDSLSLCSGSRRGSAPHPADGASYRGSRASSRASSARSSPVDSFLRSAVCGGSSSSALCRDLDDVTIPDLAAVEDRDYPEKGSRAASALPSLGGASSRRGSGDTSLTVDAESAAREIKEIHELKDQIQDVETKYLQNLKEVKDALAEAEEKYRKAMVSNAQLDNEKNNLMYQVDTLRDSLTELEELLAEARRENQDRLKELERQKHAHSVLQFHFDEMKQTLKQSEELLTEIRQLRMKQDGYVREISDLQETVDWKDKKIGALERQKEYTDAIRVERDELREEVVKLQDVLKKHGIVLGPDLSVNGDAGQSEVDGSPAAEAAPQSQTSPAEGNSVLGGTEEAEENTENHLSPDGERHVPETSCDEPPPGEHETPSPAGVHGSEERLKTVDLTDHLASKAKGVVIVSRDLQQIQTSEDVPETVGPPAIIGTETQSSSAKAHGTDPPGGPESKPTDGEAADVSLVVGTEVEEAIPVGPSQKTQQELEEGENNEAEETPSRSQAQVSTASGKKKKKKKKGKKKGGGHENKDQQGATTQKDKDSVGLTAEADTNVSASKTIKDQDRQEPDKTEHPELSEDCFVKEDLLEPNTDPGSDGHHKEKQVLEPKETSHEQIKIPHLTETRAELVEDKEDHQTPEIKEVECEDPEKNIQGSFQVESLKESDAEISGSDPKGDLLPSMSSVDPDGRLTSIEDASTIDDSSGVPQPNTDTDSTMNTEMLESSKASDHTGSRLEDEQNEEESQQAEKLEYEETAEAFLQDKPVKESVPESRMVEDDGRGILDPEPKFLSSKGGDNLNQQLWSREDTASGLQEPNSVHASGDQDQGETSITEMLGAETLDWNREEYGEVQEEPSEPQKPEPVLETTEGSSQVEATKRPNDSKLGEEDSKPYAAVEEMEPATGPDPEENLLTPGKSKDSDKEFAPDNLHTEPEAVDEDQKTSENNADSPKSEDSKVEERSPLSSSNSDVKDRHANPSMKDSEAGPEEADDREPRAETSEKLCQDDEELNGGGKAEGLTQPPREEEEPKDAPNKEETIPTQCPLAEQRNEDSDSPPHIQLDSDEEDREEDEGQSFDFDDSDMEAAIESSLSRKPQPEGTEVNEKTSKLGQSDTETNAKDGEKSIGEADQPEGDSDLSLQNVAAEAAENVQENIELKSSSTVEGSDAADVPSDSQTTCTKEVPESGKDLKKKKSKGKTKEDCKMS